MYVYLLFFIIIDKEVASIEDMISSDMKNSFQKIFSVIRGICQVLPELDLEMLKENFVSCCFHLESQVAPCNTIEDIIDLIEEKCTLMNITYIEKLVQHLQQLQQLHLSLDNACKLIVSYKEDIEKFFIDTPLDQVFDKSFSCSSFLLNCEMLAFVLDWNLDGKTLKDVQCLLSDAFDQNHIYVNFEVIKNNSKSIEITCSFPYHLTMLFITHSMKNREVLEKKGVLKLTVGCATICNVENRNEVLIQYATFTCL